jgi:retinol dehydrogenase-14
MGVNHFGHFLLSKILMPSIEKSKEGRIINVSSRAHETGNIHFDDLNWEKSYSSINSYEQSKLANVYFTRQLAKSLP